MDYLSSSWCSIPGGDRMTVKELYHIRDNNFITGSTPEDIDFNHTLSQIRYLAELLNDTITIKRHSIKKGIIGDWMMIWKAFLLLALAAHQKHPP